MFFSLLFLPPIGQPGVPVEGKKSDKGNEREAAGNHIREPVMVHVEHRPFTPHFTTSVISLQKLNRIEAAAESWRQALLIFEDLDDSVMAAQVRHSLEILDVNNPGRRL